MKIFDYCFDSSHILYLITAINKVFISFRRSYFLKKITKVLLGSSLAIIIFMIGIAFSFNVAVKWYLVIFLFVGFGIALLRLFVNSMIKKMKGKHIGVKALFFACLLSVGIPFQNWFRTDILLALNKDYLLPCIIVAVSSVVLMTILFGTLKKKEDSNLLNQ